MTKSGYMDGKTSALVAKCEKKCECTKEENWVCTFTALDFKFSKSLKLKGFETWRFVL